MGPPLTDGLRGPSRRVEGRCGVLLRVDPRKRPVKRSSVGYVTAISGDVTPRSRSSKNCLRHSPPP